MKAALHGIPGIVRIGWFSGSILLLSIPVVSWGQSITDIDPGYGERGDVITIGLTGIDPERAYEVRIGEAEAEITERTEGSLRIEIPSDAVTGRIRIRELPDGEPVESYFPLGVTAAIGVGIDPGLGLGEAQMEAASYFDIVGLNTADPTVRVLTGAATAVIAVHDEGQPVLMAVSTDGEAPVIFSAESTVAALVFTSGLFYTDHPEGATTRLSEIAAMPSFGVAVDIVEDNLSAGTDFLEDPDFATTMGNLSLELVNFYAQLEAASSQASYPQLSGHEILGIDPNVFRDDVVQGVWLFSNASPYDIPEPERYAFHNSLNTNKYSSETNADGIIILEDGTPIQILSFDTPRNEEFNISRPNPLDWVANVYAIDPDQFPFGIAQIENMFDEDYNKVFDRLRLSPLTQIQIPASGSVADMVKKATLVGLFDAGVGLLNDTLLPPPPTRQLGIPLNRPGLYLIRMYSGALYSPQNQLIRAIPDGVRSKVEMLAINALFWALKTGGIGLNATNILADWDKADVPYGMVNEVLNILARKEAGEGLEATDILYLLPSLYRAYFSKQAGNIAEKLGGKEAGKAFSSVLKIQGIMFDAAGADERYRGIISGGDCFPTHCPNLTSIQTVETALIVVGDPFAPKITSFHPLSGYRGTVVTINGEGFNPDPEGNRVEFNAPLTTDPTQAPAAPAEILEASENRLVVVVPDNAAIGKGPIRVQVLVEGTTQGTVRGVGETTKLKAPLDRFEVIEDPVITAVNPDPVIVGSPMRIIGERFPQDLNQFRVTYNEDQFELTVLNILSDTEILVQAPTFATDLEIVLRVQDPITLEERLSNTFPATVEPGTGQQGWTFTPNSIEDTVAPDNQLTLREAMMWASGTPGIHSPTEGELLRISRGSPQRPVGEGVADHIGIPNLGMNWAPITLNSPLPPMTAYDTFFFSGREIIGTGVNGDGFVLKGNSTSAKQIRIDDVKLTGFQGNGLVLDGASLCQFNNVFIEECSESGVLIKNGSQSNAFTRLEANNCGGHGVHLTGEDTAYNTFTFNFESFTQLMLDGSTNNNGGWGVLVDKGANSNKIEIGESVGNVLGGLGILDTNSTHNTVGRTYPLAMDPFLLIKDNKEGPGVRVEASHTHLRHIQAAGNAGDGIIVEGAVENIKIDTARIGFEPDGTVNPNQGSGIHFLGGVTNSQIGQDIFTWWNRDPRSAIGGNRDHGIFLENATNIRINYLDIGITQLFQQEAHNGQHGIYLLNSSDCKIGDHRFLYSVGVAGNPNGAGIRMEGADSHGNAVFGAMIGSVFDVWNTTNYFFQDTNLYGIHITGGAWGNVIGRRGNQVSLRDPVYNDIIDTLVSGVRITGSSEAGVLIDSGLDPGKTITNLDVPAGGNVVQNCNFFITSSLRHLGNRVGIILRGDARGNRIGGQNLSERNLIYGNRQVGIIVDNVNIPEEYPNTANRIIGNMIRQNWTDDQQFTRPNVYPAEAPDSGQGLGVLITDSSNQPIGGTLAGETNYIIQNGTGVYIRDSRNINVSGNYIGNIAAVSLFQANFHGGLILNNSRECVIGPDNIILGNGNVIDYDQPLDDTAGIVDYFGTKNRILGNWIGITPDGKEVLGNHNGILLISALGTRIGGFGPTQRNVIVDSAKNGILLKGIFSTDNFIGGNHIGYMVNPNGGTSRMLPNGENGILLTDGARHNRVGQMRVRQRGQDLTLPAANSIYFNSGSGVRVEGADSTKNRILFNSITGNGDSGIQTTNSGNGDPDPPIITGFRNDTAYGTVSEEIPDGSIVQVFSDSGQQGELFKGQGEVTNGGFEIYLGGTYYGNLTATVTDPDGNTSEFGTSTSIDAAFALSRVHSEVLERRITPDTSETTVGSYEARAVNSIIEVSSIDLDVTDDQLQELSGNSFYLLEDASPVSRNTEGLVKSFSIYHDVDRDGIHSEADILLAGPEPVSEGMDTLTLHMTNAIVDPVEAQRWILVAELNESAKAGDTYSVSIAESLDLSFDSFQPRGVPISPIGDFPVFSDRLVVVSGEDPYYLWMQAQFPEPFRSDPSYSAPSANPDGDALQNLFERVFGTNPLVPDASPLSVTLMPSSANFQFPWVKGINDVLWEIQTSVDASNWNTAAVSESVVPGDQADQILAEIEAPASAYGTWFARLTLSLTGQ